MWVSFLRQIMNYELSATGYERMVGYLHYDIIHLYILSRGEYDDQYDVYAGI